jgi:hypothetical protein
MLAQPYPYLFQARVDQYVTVIYRLSDDFSPRFDSALILMKRPPALRSIKDPR